MLEKIWNIKEKNIPLQKKLSKELGISSILAQLLINRDITDPKVADVFLRSKACDLHDPFLLKDMDRAVERIARAIAGSERIMIHGDYDADGITATALLWNVLKDMKAECVTHIPNRLEEGYGLNDKAVRSAAGKKIGLIITVDCGISSNKQVDLARDLGIDVIITDHHEICGIIPDAYAVISPLRDDCLYPFKHLSGVGLAFKLACALTRDTSYPVLEHLDLVAVGTVADIVSVIGENRILIKYGLSKLKDTKKKGLRALLDITGLSGKDLVSTHVGYMLGPRINAAGRIGSPDLALKLLITDDEAEAQRLAKRLDDENRSRQRIEEEILQNALIKVENEINFKNDRVIILSSESWHEGVIGIVASKLVDRFYRPTILISEGKIPCKGSGRSIEGFHLFNALSECRQYLSKFGGHQGACGLSIEKARIKDFRRSINTLASAVIMPENLMPKLDIDMEIPLGALNERLIGELDMLGPFGPGNPKPVFASNDVELKRDPVMVGKNGLKFWVTDNNVTCEAIEFRRRSQIGRLTAKDRVSVAYIPVISRWNGIESIQLNLEDIKIVASS